ncbi:MAG TPA: hypothetical protein PKE52_09145 [Bacteroidales bacterium]|jgi:hypothetical protein|nr:hypothetical protein [Bacteroidales bacterium]
MRFLLDLTGAWDADAVGIEEKAHHHLGIIRGLTPSIAAVGVVYG